MAEALREAQRGSAGQTEAMLGADVSLFDDHSPDILVCCLTRRDVLEVLHSVDDFLSENSKKCSNYWIGPCRGMAIQVFEVL